MTSHANGTPMTIVAVTTPTARANVFQTRRQVAASPSTSSALPPPATRMTRYASGSSSNPTTMPAATTRTSGARLGAARLIRRSRQIAGLAKKLDRGLVLCPEAREIDVGPVEVLERRQPLLRVDAFDQRILRLLSFVDVEALAVLREEVLDEPLGIVGPDRSLKARRLQRR